MSTQFTREESGAFISSLSLKGNPEGPLKGTTFAIKDLVDVKGLPTSGGNPSWRDSHPIAAANAVCLELLLEAGAECIGKTVTDELAFGLTGENFFYGTPLNPKAPKHIPGGSSSGSASAVACGIVDFAIGTDTGGSIRVPASNCGIFGFRPTHGIISTAGVLPLAPTFDTVGILANSCANLVKAASVLLSFQPAPLKAIGNIYCIKEAFEIADPAVGNALGQSLKLIENLFPKKIEHRSLREIDQALHASGLQNWYETFHIIQWAEIWNTFGSWIDSCHPAFGPTTSKNFQLTRELDRSNLRSAFSKRELYFRAMKNFLQKDDLLCIPTVPTPAPLKRSLGSNRTTENYYSRTQGLISIAGICRLPQVSVPITTIDGLPIGLSFLGAQGEDSFLLSVTQEITTQINI